jgi:hypothetical protein
VVGRPILIAMVAAIIIVAILTIIFFTSYKLTKSTTPTIQTPQTDHIVITPRFYQGEVWGDVAGQEGDPPKPVSIYSTMQLNFCQTINSETFVSVPGIDDTNPIILKRNADEIAISFCLQSFDQVARTWELMPRDTHVDPIYGAPEEIFNSKALSDGVKVSFDKTAVGLPAFPSNQSKAQVSSGNFTLFLNADQNTKLGNKGFYVLAIRQLDDADKTVSDTVQVRAFPLYIRVVD